MFEGCPDHSRCSKDCGVACGKFGRQNLNLAPELRHKVLFDCLARGLQDEFAALYGPAEKENRGRAREVDEIGEASAENRAGDFVGLDCGKVACAGGVFDDAGVEFVPSFVGDEGIAVVFGNHFQKGSLDSRCGSVCFEAAALAAAADASVGDGADVSEFACKSVDAEQKFSVDDYARAEPRAECDYNEVVEVFSAAVDFFADCGGVGVVAKVDVVEAEAAAQGFDYRGGDAEGKVRGEVDCALVIVAVGRADSDAHTLAVLVVNQNLDCGYEPLHIRGEIAVIGRFEFVAFVHAPVGVDDAELGVCSSDVDTY